MINFNRLLGTDFDDIFNRVETSFDEKVTIPMDIYREIDGTNVIKIAATGLKRENIKLTIKSESGKTFLYIKSVVPEKSEAQKKYEEEIIYSVKKIKDLTSLDLCIYLPNTLDYQLTTKTLEDGLLIIRIPVKEEQKPIEFTVE